MVQLHVIPSEPEIVGSADAFENWTRAGDWGSYCNNRARMEEDQHERELWEFIGLHIGADETVAKARIIERLGYDIERIMQQAESYLGRGIWIRFGWEAGGAC